MLNSLPSYPTKRSYVIKIHRDAGLGAKWIFGHIEHLGTGRLIHFSSGEELLNALLQDLCRNEDNEWQGG